MDAMNKKKWCLHGFLLIEMVTALAILSSLLLVISLSLWRSLEWQKEAQMQLKALNLSILQLEKIVEERDAPMTHQEIEGYTIEVARGPVSINQKQIDTLIPPSKNKKPKCVFNPVLITSTWTSLSGKKRAVRLLAGILRQNYE